MSRKDMWQPKQPASEVVATRSLRGFGASMACSLAAAARRSSACALIGFRS